MKDFEYAHAAPLRRYDMQQVDLLAGAWGLSQEEMAQALRAQPEQLRTWRNHEEPIPEDVQARIDRLHQVQHALWTVLPPGQYARWWRKPNGAFEGRTALDVVLSEENGFDRVIGICRSANW